MHSDDREAAQPPSLVVNAASHAAAHAARGLAKQALAKLGAALGAKAGAIAGIVLVAIALIVLLVVLIISGIGAAFQSSTAVWPVPVATDAAGLYAASGWTITSRFGWRDKPDGAEAEFHDGIDLANPDGRCPFGYHCGVPAMFDGEVQYVGWDMAASGDPAKTGGGELVILQNGEHDHTTLYAHLEPYRLYVRLEGMIVDAFDRDEYRQYRDYQPIGQGELMPDLSNGEIEMRCQHEMPNFIATRTGGGAVQFLYDRPASCITTVVWGLRGGGWEGWTSDNPGHLRGDARRAELSWQTPIDPGKQAQDVALRFRAHLVPPDPPPTPTASPTVAPVTPAPARAQSAPAVSQGVAGQAGQGRVAAAISSAASPTATPGVGRRNGKPRACEALPAGWMRCQWALADIPTEQERFAQQPDPWLMAARASAPISAPQHDDQQAAEGATATARLAQPQLNSTAPLLVQTATPWAGARQPADGSGGLLDHTNRVSMAAPVQLPTAAYMGQDTQATITPSDRVWLAPGGIATWTLRLANNQRGFWSVQVSPADPRFSFSADAACSSSVGNSISCRLAGTATTLQISVLVAPEATSLIADLPIMVSDTAAGGSGVVVGAPEMRVGVGTPPTATLPILTVTPDPTAPAANAGIPDCTSLQLVRLSNVTAPQPRLVAPAAASFAAVRQEIIERTGVDALAVLADALRDPAFNTSKPGVSQRSWHKAGRAIDLNQGGPFVRVAEGSKFRLYLNNVDITAIFEAHGWNRIPVQGDVLEWWHYEWHPDGIAWTSAMLQVWDLPALQAAFPAIDWATIGCVGGSNSGDDSGVTGQEREQLCVIGAPSYTSPVEYIAGCGPPVRVGDRAYQLDSRLGYVGLTGSTSGPHLHLGMQMKSYDGSWPMVDICTPEWLRGRVAPNDTSCYTEMADPLAFLPRAPGNPGTAAGELALPPGTHWQAAGAFPSGTTPTPLIPEGAPYQLPPPNYPDSLVFPPDPAATPVGQYWSPYADGGQYGGGSVGAWFCSIWGGWPWCN